MLFEQLVSTRVEFYSDFKVEIKPIVKLEAIRNDSSVFSEHPVLLLNLFLFKGCSLHISQVLLPYPDLLPLVLRDSRTTKHLLVFTKHLY